VLLASCRMCIASCGHGHGTGCYQFEGNVGIILLVDVWQCGPRHSIVTSLLLSGCYESCYRHARYDDGVDQEL
jgi:hypothetical protein